MTVPLSHKELAQSTEAAVVITNSPCTMITMSIGTLGSLISTWNYSPPPPTTSAFSWKLGPDPDSRPWLFPASFLTWKKCQAGISSSTPSAGQPPTYTMYHRYIPCSAAGSLPSCSYSHQHLKTPNPLLLPALHISLWSLSYQFHYYHCRSNDSDPCYQCVSGDWDHSHVFGPVEDISMGSPAIYLYSLHMMTWRAFRIVTL